MNDLYILEELKSLKPVEVSKEVGKEIIGHKENLIGSLIVQVPRTMQWRELQAFYKRLESWKKRNSDIDNILVVSDDIKFLRLRKVTKQENE